MTSDVRLFGMTIPEICLITVSILAVIRMISISKWRFPWWRRVKIPINDEMYETINDILDEDSKLPYYTYKVMTGTEIKQYLEDPTHHYEILTTQNLGEVGFLCEMKLITHRIKKDR